MCFQAFRQVQKGAGLRDLHLPVVTRLFIRPRPSIDSRRAPLAWTVPDLRGQAVCVSFPSPDATGALLLRYVLD